MKSLRFTQFVLLALGLAILGILSVASSVNSPIAVRRLGEAILVLGGAVGAFKHSRRLPSRSPLMLAGALAGLALTLIRPLLGPQFPMLLTILVGIIWLGLWIARWRVRPWTA